MARDLATAAELTCPKCKMFACDCELPKTAKPSPPQDICTRCRRHKLACECASHVEVEPVSEDAYGNLLLNRSTPTARIEAEVQEALHHHLYTRDAVALANQVRKLAERVYRA